MGKHPFDIVAADFNGDGKMDLAVSDKGSNKVSVLMGNGDGTFSQRWITRQRLPRRDWQ